MRIYLDTVGCRLNQAEIETMARQFRTAGHEIVAVADNAELAVVNTCAVTSAAAADSRGKLRRLARDGAVQIVATGCWATLQPELAAAMPRVSRVVPNGDKDQLVASLLRVPNPVIDPVPMPRAPLPGRHRRTRAFIKAQDGCNNHCTFCVTTVARGESRSRPLADVIRDVRCALEGGSQEIVLTGVQLGSWGQDFGLRLKMLVQEILRQTAVPRLRLSSIEPWDLDGDFFSLWEERRLCRHVHLPLQSGCGTTLRRMARKTTPQSFRKLIAEARRVVPDMAITTDVIAGFPGETESEFAESLEFVREMDFAGGHAFPYSARAGTAAARLRDQVPSGDRRRRNAVYRALFDNAVRAYGQMSVGKTRAVLWESAVPADDQGWQLQGLTDDFVRVTAFAPEPRWNKVDWVRLTASAARGVNGIILKSG